jgi:hypothetical protein
MSTPEPWRPTRADDGPSPLQRSMRGAWLILAGLMALLFLLGLLAVGLSFMSYEGPAAWDSAGPMLALGLVTGVASVGCFVMARRPRPAQRPSGWVAPAWSEHTWHRPYRLPAWTDWLSLLFPAGVTLGLAGGAVHSLHTQTAPVTSGDVAGAVGATLLVGFLLFALVAVSLRTARRELVRLTLHPEGLVVALRNGSERQVRRDAIAGVFLSTIDISGMDVGTVGVALHGGERLSFREPLSAPLPYVAEHLARHLSVPVARG